jgi:urea transport system permease protein
MPMLRALHPVFITICLVLMVFVRPAFSADDLKTQINALSTAKLGEMADKIQAIAATGDPKVVPALEALAAGDLYFRKSDGAVFMTKPAGANFSLIDPLTGEVSGEEAKGALTKIKVNNNLRRAIRSALGGLTLLSPDRTVRLSAADAVLKSPSAENLGLLDTAIAKETDSEVRKRMETARAVSLLGSDRGVEEKRAAIDTIRTTIGGRDAIGILMSAASSVDPALKPDLDSAIAKIEGNLVFWDAAQNIWYGFSLGSVLLLAAIGLAITFGVMGIINMAHGEMVMLGAYSTFVVQDVIRSHAPSLFDWSLAIALPVAFLVTAIVGLVLERGVIRFLYGRPLETLLATWGISLILQQAIRTIFGPTNQEVGNPSWMSGSFPLGGMTITWNRMWIVAF